MIFAFSGLFFLAHFLFILFYLLFFLSTYFGNYIVFICSFSSYPVIFYMGVWFKIQAELISLTPSTTRILESFHATPVFQVILSRVLFTTSFNTPQTDCLFCYPAVVLAWVCPWVDWFLCSLLFSNPTPSFGIQFLFCFFPEALL